MSRRTERVASLVRSILAEAIQTRLSDPRIEALTSITRVEVSPDLSYARVFVSVMATETRQQLTLKALRHAIQHLRRYLGDRIELRKVPEIDFRLDNSLQQSFRTVQEIDRLMEELGERPLGEEPETDSDDEADGADADGETESFPPDDAEAIGEPRDIHRIEEDD